MTGRELHDAVPFSRRQFLARCGVLGAAASVMQVPLPAAPARAAAAAAVGARAALETMTLDTINGLAAFVVPGPDPYSQAQGVTHPQPGGIAARAGEGMVELFDRYLPWHDSFVQALVAGFSTGMSDAPVPALYPVLQAAEGHAATVDRALQEYLANDETVPLSLLLSLALNFFATAVDPGSVSGPIPSSPFASLAYADKAEVLRRIEEDSPELVAMLDGEMPEPMRAALSGLGEFLGGALPAVAALFSYSEWGVLDPERGVATRRPVGWDISRYARGRTRPSDGWRELKGYYRGRRTARAATRRRRRRRRRRATRGRRDA